MTTISTLEAMLLTNCQYEQVVPAEAATLCPGYESLLQRGLLECNPAGFLMTTTYGERAIDEYLEAERWMRSTPDPSPSEYAWVVLLGLGIAALIVQIQL